MKNVVLFFLIVSYCYSQEPSLFLPEVFKDLPNVRDFTMDTSQSEAYFTIQGYSREYSYIGWIKKGSGGWSTPEIVNFSGLIGVRDLEPFLSPDGLRLYFSSNRLPDSVQAKKDMDIWYVERSSKESKWSKPMVLGPEINSDKNEFYPSVAANGNLYFTAEYPDSKGKEDIYLSVFKNGEYMKPVALGNEINSEKLEYNAFISPKERFLIFSSYRRKDDLGRGDLYISEKSADGNWLPARHLDKSINTVFNEFCPFVDTKRDILYFTSKRSLEGKSVKSYDNYATFMNATKLVPNGLSRIYYVSLRKN